MSTLFFLVIVAVAISFAAAFFYVSKIISLPPQGRAIDYLCSKSEKNQRIIACIGDSLTHGNIGVSWVDQLRKEFPEDIFLNEGINGDVIWQVHQRLEPILACKPDVVLLMIGSNDAMGSFDLNSGLSYKRHNNLPEAPSFEKYKEQLQELLERLSDIPKIVVCTIPPLGENKDSLANKHVDKFNEFIRSTSRNSNIDLLPISESIWLEIASRTYPLKSDYNANEIKILRRIFGGIFHHYIFKKSWNQVAKSKGQWILFDQIHLNERGANIVFKIVKDYISKA
ncbi:SGNH/GDSL hydrolase family protein [Candidatus Pseudothioglobus singularis]|nr:SGNH/GDSL hydrolase family protein [Candidatus Pseudothioglobus singularis]